MALTPCCSRECVCLYPISKYYLLNPLNTVYQSHQIQNFRVTLVTQLCWVKSDSVHLYTSLSLRDTFPRKAITTRLTTMDFQSVSDESDQRVTDRPLNDRTRV